MANLEQIYNEIPSQGIGQFYRAPRPETLRNLTRCVEVAYEQIGLDPYDESSKSFGTCPGLAGDEGSFQISNRSPYGNRSMDIRFSASNPEQTRVAEGKISVIKGSFNEAAFQVKRPGNAMAHSFEMTRRSWATLIGFVMEQAGSGSFIPVETKHLLAISDRRHTRPSYRR